VTRRSLALKRLLLFMVAVALILAAGLAVMFVE
jgi:hypothetical protein